MHTLHNYIHHTHICTQQSENCAHWMGAHFKSVHNAQIYWLHTLQRCVNTHCTDYKHSILKNMQSNTMCKWTSRLRIARRQWYTMHISYIRFHTFWLTSFYPLKHDDVKAFLSAWRIWSAWNVHWRRFDVEQKYFFKIKGPHTFQSVQCKKFVVKGGGKEENVEQLVLV